MISHVTIYILVASLLNEYLNGNIWVQQLLLANTSFSARPDITNFYRAANSVRHVLSGAHEHTLLNLLYTNCVPILTYACDIKEYSAADMSDCNIAMNNALRKIFGFRDWRSIRTLREVFNFKSLYDIFKLAKDRFLISCSHSHNPIISHLFSVTH